MKTELTTEPEIFQFLARKQALSLEIKGMKRRGRSVYSIVKEEYGYTGSKQSVFDQMQADYDNFINQLENNND